jgi:hypothetical protein
VVTLVRNSCIKCKRSKLFLARKAYLGSSSCLVFVVKEKEAVRRGLEFAYAGTVQVNKDNNLSIDSTREKK